MSHLARMLGNKKCSNCFRIKPTEAFYRKRDPKRGVDTWQSRCKDCNAEVVAGYHARARGRSRFHRRELTSTIPESHEAKEAEQYG